MIPAAPADASVRDAAHHCITCSDEGVPMRVIATGATRDLARCAAAQADSIDVDTTLVGPVAPGDELLVHAGVALAHLGTGAGGACEAR